MQKKLLGLLARITTLILFVVGATALNGSAANAAPVSTPITVTFENGDTSGYRLGSNAGTGYSADFEGMPASEVAAAPTDSGHSGNAAKFTVAGQPWSGTTFLDLELGGNRKGTLYSADAITNHTDVVSLDVYSTFPGRMMLKLEGTSNCSGFEFEPQTPHAGSGWETLTFPWEARVTDGCTRASFFPLFFTDGRDGNIVYIDNVSFPGAAIENTVSSPSTLINFQNVNPSWLNYHVDPILEAFGGAEKAYDTTTVPANGTSTKASKISISAGDQCWAGTTLNVYDTATTLISDGHTSVTGNVYVPTAGTLVRMALEDSRDNQIKIEADASATDVGWNRLTWDFSGVWNTSNTNLFNKVSVFPGFSCGSSPQVVGDFWFDDIAFNGATTPALPSGNGGGGGNTVTTYNVRLDAADRPAGSTINHNTVLNWWTLGDGRPANDGIYVRYMDKGATFNLDYTVTDQDGAAVSGETVELAVTVPDNNVTWNDSNGTARTTYTLSGTTNSSGVVTFTVTNTNTLAENRRNDLTTWTDPSGLTFKWEFLPNIPGKGSATQNLDRIWGHVVDTTANLNAPAYAKIRFNGDSATKAFQAPSNWGVGSDKYIRYQTYGQAMELSYKVTDDANAPMADQTVTLTLSDNGTWTVDGVAKGTGDQITATTNAQGIATFNLVNTNAEAAAESGRPSNMLTTWTDNSRGTPDLVGAFIVSVGANTEDRVTLWTHITLAPTAAVVIPVETENKGAYPHIRLDKPFLDTKFDASWWDGVWQYRDADTKAYLKYVPVGSTFKLTYVVTDNDNRPMSGVPVSLIVNANHSCSKTFFFYEGSLIGPDDCSGGGQTELPAKLTDSFGRVSFVLTNTNAIGEAMPLDLNGLPNGKEIGTNIKPHLVGATVEAIDMLFAHFVTPNEKASAKAPAATSVIAGQSHLSTFTFLDENGNPIADANVLFMVNGGSSRTGWVSTDKQGRAVVRSASSAGARGQQIVAVSLIREGKLPLTASTTINLISSKPVVSIAGSKKSVVVTVRSASGKAVKISVGGKVFNRTAKADSASFRIPASAGAKKVVVTVSGKSSSKTVTVTK